MGGGTLQIRCGNNQGIWLFISELGGGTLQIRCGNNRRITAIQKAKVEEHYKLDVETTNAPTLSAIARWRNITN